MDLISRAVRNARATVRAAGQFGDSSIPPNSSAGGTLGYGNVTEATALSVSTVMTCTKVLFDDFGILPFGAFTGDKDGVKHRIDDQPRIVAQPFGPDMSVAAGMGQIVISRALRGRAFLAVDDTEGGFPTQVSVMHPDRVQVGIYNGRKQFRINGMWFGPGEIKHIPGIMLPGALDGLDPISYQRIMFQLAGDVAAFGGNFFRQGATPGGVIEVPGQGDRRKAREVKDAWEAGHGGVQNAHRPAVLFGGATWKQMAIAPENAQFLQTRAFSREEICGWFGVPFQRIHAIVDNASQGGGKGLEAIDKGYLTHTILPISTAIEQVWDAMIPGGDRSWTWFNFNALLRASALERAQIAQIHRLTGVRNRNEIRADEGWDAIPGADGADYNIPFNTNSSVPPLIDPNTGLPPVDPKTDGGTP